MKKSYFKIAIKIIIGLVLLSLIFWAQSNRANHGGKGFGGDFTLTNHAGEAVTDKDFKDQYRLIYFGFTFCPAICPTELQRVATILNELGSLGEAIQPIFITVDPERDTPEMMKNYVEMFHPRLIGLTGTIEQIEQAKTGYNVYSKKVKDEEMSEYTVDHSSFIYFMGPDDTLLRIFKISDPTETIIKNVRGVLEKANPQ